MLAPEASVGDGAAEMVYELGVELCESGLACVVEYEDGVDHVIGSVAGCSQ